MTADYRGNVGVVLFNFGSEDFEVNVGDRIAQLILERISMAPAIEVDKLTVTERGGGGYGSTGTSRCAPGGGVGHRETKTDANDSGSGSVNGEKEAGRPWGDLDSRGRCTHTRTHLANPGEKRMAFECSVPRW